MPSQNLVSENNWVLAASGPGPVVITSYANGGKMVVTSSSATPSFDRRISGHIVPLNENMSLTLVAGERLWLSGLGHFTVTTET